MASWVLSCFRQIGGLDFRLSFGQIIVDPFGSDPIVFASLKVDVLAIEFEQIATCGCFVFPPECRFLDPGDTFVGCVFVDEQEAIL